MVHPPWPVGQPQHREGQAPLGDSWRIINILNKKQNDDPANAWALTDLPAAVGRLWAPRLVTAIKIRMKNPESLWAVIGSSFIIFDSHRRDSLRSSSIHFVHLRRSERSECSPASPSTRRG